MIDIQLKNETVFFHKQLYHESELLLARCYNFEYDELTGVISAHLRYTSKQALFYFIELAFKNFWESPLQEGRKNDFLSKIEEVYAIYENHVTALMDKKLPYAANFKKHQVEGEVFAYYKKYSFIAYEMRLGKAQPLTSDIITPFGIKKMGDIMVGDIINSTDGGTCEVTGVFPQGKKAYYKVYFSDDTVAECCEEHLWKVKDIRRLEKQCWHVKPLKELMEGKLYIPMNGQADIPKYKIPKTLPVVFMDSAKELKPIHPYLLGVLLGDGCIINTVSISTDDHEELLPIIRPMLPPGMVIKKQKGNNYSWAIVPENRKTGSDGNPLIHILRSLKLFNLHSYDKFVPEQYLFTSVQERIELLSGLLDTDGHISLTCSRLSYSTSSPYLRDNIIFLVQSLGGLATYLEDNRDDQRRVNYIVSIVFDNSIVPLKLKRRIARYLPKKRILSKKITKIEYAGETECQCISVNSKDNCYLTNNFTVTHNTILAASLSRLLDIRTTVIICPANPKWEWFRQLTQKWGFNELYFTILDAAKSKNLLAFQERFVIINYDIVGKFHNELLQRNVGHFILDEVHKCKNVHATRTKNVKKLLDAFPDAKVTFLSGTPIKNRVNDIFAYLKLSNHPLGKNNKKFLDEYTISTTSRGHGTRVTGGKNLVDLQKKLANFMLIKTQDECLDVPKKMFLTYNYSLEDYREEYNKIIEELSQVKDISSLTGSLHSLNIITAKAKLKGVIEIAEDIIENGQKVVIFCSYKDPLHELQKHFGERCVLIDGSVPSHKRMEYCESFRDNEGKEVFLGNMVAAGEGTDLSCALNVIFVNFPLTPDEIMQPMNRCENMARTKILTVIYTSCDDSIDEYLYELIEDKQNEINIFTGKENLNIHKHNTIEHLVSKLLKREPEEEVSEPVTHSLEGGENVEQHIIGNKSIKLLNPNPDAHIHPDYSHDVPKEQLEAFNKSGNNFVTEKLTLEEFNRRYPKDGSLPVETDLGTEQAQEVIRAVKENREIDLVSAPSDDFTPPDFL